ncbi:hypothetical protein EHE19_001525 [Ruminiclostridium herbifermentans]|uniref:Uncharacterized protein n=1 Tax=Ruminiclostridium herbifermentans TaxID=2488810 RepID=A0A4V6YE21_9FIRM|nr:hypothetical protein [Ruminiclostridium herbifermentans]QNU67253.1 hypothetical protein EHE19_001525 [Ruminiclostridium herbifermentans]
MYSKALTLNELNTQIEDLTLVRDVVIKCIKEKPVTAEGIIVQKFIEIQSITEVASFANEKGFRIKSASGERKYTSNDIRDIIENKNNAGYIFKVAKIFFDFNKSKYKIKGLISRLKKV